MTTFEHSSMERLRGCVATWVQAHPLQAAEVDCATAVMLKIIDGKCKMKADEKKIMAALYDTVKHLAMLRLPAELHTLIAEARESVDPALKMQVYERRVLAETMVSRPTMKAFKARIRGEGLLSLVEVAT